MEVKVSVEGVQRIVCGVTEKTTCQEVVIALAQALGRTGRYTLREMFKEYERNVSPDERLLASLGKYGDQTKDVQLTLIHISASGDEANHSKPQMRRLEGAGRVRRGSGGLAQHRQSLPPLSHLHQQTQPPPEEPKRPKRKSLTLMEEAWGWLENLGRGGKQQSGRDKEKNKGVVKSNGESDSTSQKVSKNPSIPKEKKDKNRGTSHQPLMSCLRNRGRGTDKSKEPEMETEEPAAPGIQTSLAGHESEKMAELRRLVSHQQTSLKDLKLQIEGTDQQILELELLRSARTFPESLSEEEEQLRFWMNELKAEEVHEEDLQSQFLQIKRDAAECKSKLEEYKQKLQAMNLSSFQKRNLSAPIKEDLNPTNQSHQVTETKRFVTTLESHVPYVFVSANHVSNPLLNGPAELREWWRRQNHSPSPTSGIKARIVHRSEITIQLGSTRV